MTQPVVAPRMQEPPNLEPDLVGPEAVERTFVFCDVAGFTEMTEEFGDRGAHAVIRRYREIVREVVQEFRGEELELRGDGFLLAFRSPSTALECAFSIRRHLTVGARRPGSPVSVRIGVHTGRALQDDDGYFGRTLIIAARIAERARVNEILASDACRRAAESPGVREAGSRVLQLKGIRRMQRVYVEAPASPVGSRVG